MPDFYDELAPRYHLIFADWEKSIARQGHELAAIVRAEWPGHRPVLDVACGIGTDRLLTLMQRAGFERVQRLDEVFYQPVLIGTRPA